LCGLLEYILDLVVDFDEVVVEYRHPCIVDFFFYIFIVDELKEEIGLPFAIFPHNLHCEVSPELSSYRITQSS
jgi:hypothetical protein